MTDYIIVGGGSAGCVLANRLSANPAVDVTLIEAGGWDRSPFIGMPAGYFQLMKTGQIDWGYHTEPQEHLAGRRLFWPRAKVLGGCSCVNGMIYIRGSATDYDHWAALGNSGWSFRDCLALFLRAENWNGPRSPIHGHDGPLHTSRYGVHHPLSKAFVEAGVQAGYPYRDDFNGGEQEGFGPCDSTIKAVEDKGIRASTAFAYLHPVKERKNLRIITKALATRVIVERGRAVGVEFLRRGRKEVLRAHQEVLLSGGAINSPQLLQLSGIGDPAHLRSLGIEVTAALPGVGQNPHDHLSVGVQCRSTQPNSLLTYIRPVRAAAALARYMWDKGGPRVSRRGSAGLRQKPARSDRPGHPVPLRDDHVPRNGRVVIPEHGFTPLFNISRPKSRGWLKIQSADPTQHPRIQPNYFSDPDDIRVYREGIRIGREVLAQKAFDPYRGVEYAPARRPRPMPRSTST